MASISVHRDEPSPANETGLFLCMLEPTEWEGQTTQFSRVCADMNEPLAFLLYGVVNPNMLHTDSQSLLCLASTCIDKNYSIGTETNTVSIIDQFNPETTMI